METNGQIEKFIESNVKIVDRILLDQISKCKPLIKKYFDRHGYTKNVFGHEQTNSINIELTASADNSVFKVAVIDPDAVFNKNINWSTITIIATIYATGNIAIEMTNYHYSRWYNCYQKSMPEANVIALLVKYRDLLNQIYDIFNYKVNAEINRINQREADYVKQLTDAMGPVEEETIPTVELCNNDTPKLKKSVFRILVERLFK